MKKIMETMFYLVVIFALLIVLFGHSELNREYYTLHCNEVGDVPAKVEESVWVVYAFDHYIAIGSINDYTTMNGTTGSWFDFWIEVGEH